MPIRRKVSLRRRTATAGSGRKTRITIRIDDDVLAWFRRRARAGGGGGYQSLVNLALRDYIAREPLEATLRRVIREELARLSGGPSAHAYGYEEPRPSLVADDAGNRYGMPSGRARSRGRSANGRKRR